MLIQSTGSTSAVPLYQFVDPDPLSAQGVEIPRTWLGNCDSNHKSCVAPSAQLPTRYLDTSENVSPNKVTLRELKDSPNPGDNRYVALSHCWGKGRNLCTTHSTLQSHKNGIEISILPQTFKDAVAVVRKLGIRYLWIDSLCIIQDDLRDWQVESANMAAIYRDSYLVLGAARGESDAQGFLGSRRQPDTATLASSDAVGSLVLQLQPPEAIRWTNADVDPTFHEPLGKRAWCLQERYLPRRMLLYGTQQMFWDCNEVSASEDGDSMRRDGDRLLRICATANIPVSVLARTCRDQADCKKDVNHIDWYGMVENYMSRDITKTTDRLPALAGLAKATAEASKDEYLAGLWKSALIEGLTWCGSQGAETLSHPEEYIAPSWSWASVVGPLQFPIYTWWQDRASWRRMSDFEPLATHVSHTFELQDLDPHGRLKGGSLKLTAAPFPIASIEPRQDDPPEIFIYFGQEPGRSPFADKNIGLVLKTPHETTEIWVEGGFDKPRAKRQKSGWTMGWMDRWKTGRSQLFVIFLTRLPFILENGFIEHRFGLIVEKVGEDERYRRVGFIDGCLLRKVYSKERRQAMKLALDGRTDKFGIAGFRRPLQDSDMHEVDRPNILAYDPLALESESEMRDIVLV